MATEFFLKKLDVLPVLQSQLSDDVGFIDLSSATGVYFAYRPRYLDSGAVTSIKLGSIVSAVSGIVQYTWTTGDTITPQVYLGEWIVNFSGNQQMTFPNDSYITFEIASGLI